MTAHTPQQVLEMAGMIEKGHPHAGRMDVKIVTYGKKKWWKL